MDLLLLLLLLFIFQVLENEPNACVHAMSLITILFPHKSNLEQFIS